jgi:serine protease Do
MRYPDENNNFTPENENPYSEEQNTPEDTPSYSEPRQEYTVSDDSSSRLWSEPRYESSEENHTEAYSPSANTYSTQYTEPQETKPKKTKEKKNHGFLKSLCVIVLSVALSASACYCIVDYKLSNSKAVVTTTTTQVVLGSSDTDVTAETVSNNSSAVNQIYNMACNYQVVGINTSVNTTNIFGQTTSAAVSGTGFVISKDGYIMTNYHVISYAATYGYELTVMFNDGTSVTGEVVGYLEENDVAVIKVDPSELSFTLNPVTFGDSDAIAAGDTVYAVGNPLGELTYSITDGIVSALDRVITTSDELTGSSTSINMFQITAAVNSGNSGGPVYDSEGKVIGIVTAKYSDSGVEGLGFAIPINDAVSIATQLIEKGYVAGASLGISCNDTTDVFSSFAIQYYSYPYGVVVMGVNEGSAAEKAGIQTGDIITALNGEEVTSIDELKLALRRLSPGDEGTVTVYRVGSSLGTGESMNLTIVFDETSNTSAQTSTQQTQDSSTDSSTDNSTDNSGGSYYNFPSSGNSGSGSSGSGSSGGSYFPFFGSR